MTEKKLTKKTETDTMQDAGKSISKIDAVDILTSALAICKEQGITARYVEKAGVLWLGFPGLKVEEKDGKVAFKLA